MVELKLVSLFKNNSRMLGNHAICCPRLFSISLKIILNVPLWLRPQKYSGTIPTYFSYVLEKYGMVAAQPVAHLECQNAVCSCSVTSVHSYPL